MNRKRKTVRNETIMRAVLGGKTFTALAKEHKLSNDRTRVIFLDEVKKAGPDIWNEGIESGVNNTYATPSIVWFKNNVERILGAYNVNKGTKFGHWLYKWHKGHKL